ncbi:hypothetical protein GSS87_02445 [Corynebacterium sp. 4HC-13]|uniref:Uncharacterized protein n=2 Tax=Corynebacterium anserum TaxID=2684406 RepID=A0A7G7YQT7_9CORY|nr:hypothetical protein [Corynebacterium anserum]QNH96857.1 hypothetical protein GP473_01540 [Corynebacterium anserum]
MGSSDATADLLKKLSPDHDPNNFYGSLTATAKGNPGDVLKTAPSDFSLGFTVPGWKKSLATRVAYVSTNVSGHTIPVTGTVLRSPVKWNGPGKRPLLAIAPGTQGAGDSCAPGKKMDQGLGSEGITISTALNRGWHVALTDLPGLGNPAIQHTYMNRVEQGRATLDMARAAGRMGLKGLSPKNPIATWGYSQGGGASAAALELQPQYAPELNLVAGMAGGVPANLFTTANAIDNAPLAGAIGYTTNGLLQAYPEIRPEIEKEMNAKGKALLKESADQCAEETMLKLGYTDSRTLTKSGKPLGEIMRNNPVIKAAIQRQEIGNLTPQVPVFVAHGTHDDTIPVEQGRIMAQKWCRAGAKIHYQEFDLPRLGPLIDHGTPMIASLQPAMDWLDAGFHGKGYSLTSCSDIPS